MGAVIDEPSFPQARGSPHGGSALTPDLELIAGGECDSEVGWFVHPTIYSTRTRSTIC